MAMFKQQKPSSAEVVHEQAGNLLQLARELEKASRMTDDPELQKKLRDLTRSVAESSDALSGISAGIAQRRYKN